MSRLFDILDGIISSDYRDEILGSADQIVAYAANGCGVSISYADAELIARVGKQWLHSQQHGNGEWERMRHDAAAALADN